MPEDIVLIIFFKKQRKALARVSPNGESIATPSICLYKISLKMKYDSLVAKNNNSINSDLFKPSTLSFWSYNNSVQMLMVSSSRMLVKGNLHLSYPYKSYCLVQQFKRVDTATHSLKVTVHFCVCFQNKSCNKGTYTVQNMNVSGIKIVSILSL